MGVRAETLNESDGCVLGHTAQGKEGILAGSVCNSSLSKDRGKDGNGGIVACGASLDLVASSPAKDGEKMDSAAIIGGSVALMQKEDGGQRLSALGSSASIRVTIDTLTKSVVVATQKCMGGCGFDGVKTGASSTSSFPSYPWGTRVYGSSGNGLDVGLAIEMDGSKVDVVIDNFSNSMHLEALQRDLKGSGLQGRTHRSFAEAVFNRPTLKLANVILVVHFDEKYL